MKVLLILILALVVGTAVSLYVAAELDARMGEPFIWQVRLPAALFSNILVLAVLYWLGRKYGGRWGFGRKS